MDESGSADVRRPGSVPDVDDAVGGAGMEDAVGGAGMEDAVGGAGMEDAVGGADLSHAAGGADMFHADTDGDGLPDTALGAVGADLLVQTDLDADGLADRVLRIGLDGVVRPEPVEPDDLVVGSAPAVWPGLLGRLLGPDP